MPTIYTRILAIDPLQPEPEPVAAAAAVIRAGHLVAFPTETVYGLGANALDAVAIDRIFAAKQRPFSDPLIIHLASAETLDRVAVDIPAAAWSLAERFWPGPLTLILKRAPLIPANVSAGLATVAVRVPAHPVAHALLERSRVPIAAPSANLFSRPSPTLAKHVLEDLDGRIDLILDGGATTIGLESTVLDLTRDPPELLRLGGVSFESLHRLLPNVREPRAPRIIGRETPASAPGGLLKHYAPRMPVAILRGPVSVAAPAMHRTVNLLRGHGLCPGLLVPDEEVPLYADLRTHLLALGPGSDVEQIATALFARLRDIEQSGADVLLIRDVLPKSGLGAAISDRLFRAAEGHVLDTALETQLEEFFAWLLPQNCVAPMARQAQRR